MVRTLVGRTQTRELPCYTALHVSPPQNLAARNCFDTLTP
jgi:hypothetical protein